jgi:transcriptional regulator with XRE-family HTH domain/predicted RNA binding protein YcfA (HicA-like mRNA interferase family)
MGSLLRDINDRLTAKGWVLIRKNGHATWKHPSGSRITLPSSIKDVGCKRTNYFKQIERAERSVTVITLTDPPKDKPVTATAAPSRPAPVPPPVPTEMSPEAQRKSLLRYPPHRRLNWLRDTARIKRVDMAKGMADCFGAKWTTGLIKKAESGGYTLTEPEVVQWMTLTGQPMFEGIYPARPDDEPTAAAPTPEPRMRLTWGDYMKETRLSRGMSLNDLADKMGPTANATHLGRCERGIFKGFHREFVQPWLDAMGLKEAAISIPVVEEPYFGRRVTGRKASSVYRTGQPATWGKVLSDARIKTGHKLDELATLLKISVTHISHVEHEKVIMRVQDYGRWLIALRLNPDKLPVALPIRVKRYSGPGDTVVIGPGPRTPEQLALLRGEPIPEAEVMVEPVAEDPGIGAGPSRQPLPPEPEAGEAPIPVSAVPITPNSRQSWIKAATDLLNSPRFTDEEVRYLSCLLRAEAQAILMAEVTSTSPH